MYRRQSYQKCGSVRRSVKSNKCATSSTSDVQTDHVKHKLNLPSTKSHEVRRLERSQFAHDVQSGREDNVRQETTNTKRYARLKRKLHLMHCRGGLDKRGSETVFKRKKVASPLSHTFLDNNVADEDANLPPIVVDEARRCRRAHRALAVRKKRHNNLSQETNVDEHTKGRTEKFTRSITAVHQRINQSSCDTRGFGVDIDGEGSSNNRKIFEEWNFGPPKDVCPDCGAMMWFEERSSKSTNHDIPHFSICCQIGKVKLPMYRRCPDYLHNLLQYNGDRESRKFRSNIRAYNSIFAFTSMGGHVDYSVNNGRGPYVFRLNGQNHHKIGSLLPVDGNPKFAQLYIYDTDNEVRNRMGIGGNNCEKTLDAKIVENLIFMFDTCNELAKVFRMARDRFKGSTHQHVTITLLERRERDGRQYNLPTTSEIAALSVGFNGESIGFRDVVVEEKSGLLRRINEKHPSFMAMQYPILFPYAEDGFRPNISYVLEKVPKSCKRTTVTMCEYYAYIIQFRDGDGQTLLKGGRLFQQFLVDAYTSIEEDRLSWIRNNQRHIRSEIYRGLRDAVTAGDTCAISIGKRMVLPSSFTGGPRYMVQNYQDAMAICRWAGSPDYFMTFTCNPKWPEIKEYLKCIQGQLIEDRPDIVARVFHIKLLELLQDIKRGFFGRVKAVLYTIEFQKRGLPHAHILIFLQKEDKPKTIADVDQFVSAEIPNKIADPLAYASVTQFMIHGPCGAHNTKCPCMVDGKCSKHYPRKFVNETSFDKKGFPLYRRRDKGNYVRVTTNIKLDNGWVIPHNVDLVIKYQAHINVEVCNRARSIKYLFKYINKGHDRSTMVIEENNVTDHNFVKQVDEVKTYLDCRYISAAESCWRIYEFEIQYRSPAVERLQFHMPEEHLVFFGPKNNLQEVSNRPNVEHTIFTQWLETNKMYPEARELTYADFPTRWVWNKKLKKWTRRKKGTTIGRIYYAHPTSGERFYLRLLLNIVKGPCTFEEIRTFNNVVYDSFKTACSARGLLEDDNEWNDAIIEAGHWSSASFLREMFVMMLLFCEITDPMKIWEKHWELLSDDITWRQRRVLNDETVELEEDQVKGLALEEVEKLMRRNNRSLTEFSASFLPTYLDRSSLSNSLLREEQNYDIDELEVQLQTMIPALNLDQRIVFDVIQHAVQSGDGGFFFVYGSGGTGKTFLWKAIINSLRAKGMVVLAVASSGIASLLLPGGKTAHSKFKIPITLEDNSVCNISKQSSLAELLRKTNLIIWDEAPMVHRNALEAFEKTMTDIMTTTDNYDESKIFGGKTVLLGGDFRQTLPVIAHGTRQMIVQAAINQSTLWSRCTVFELKENMRLKNNNVNLEEKNKIANFCKWVLDVGEGKIEMAMLGSTKDQSWIQIPKQFLIPHGNDEVKKIVEYVYPDLEKRLTENNFLRDRCILTPTNEAVEVINSFVISNLEGDVVSYFSADSVSPLTEGSDDQNMVYPTEFLNSLQVSGIPNHKLELKIGVPIMLLRNLNQGLGLCNGTRLVVTQLGSRVIEAQIITGNNSGRKVLIPRIILTSVETKWPFVLRRRQFPIKVCFAMTINKSQGQTLENVGIYLPQPVFAHGQLYVAISRTTSYQGLKMLIKNPDSRPTDQTQNIVYKEVFNSLSAVQTTEKSAGNGDEI